MGTSLSRDELVALVQRIMDAEGTEEELDRLEEQLAQSVPDPNVSDYIFFPEDGEMTAEQVVDKALSYRPYSLP